MTALSFISLTISCISETLLFPKEEILLYAMRYLALLGVVSGIIGARVKQKDLKKPPHVRRYKACRAEPLYMQGSNPLVPTNYTGSNTATCKCKK
jgi:hypothetical protein